MGWPRGALCARPGASCRAGAHAASDAISWEPGVVLLPEKRSVYQAEYVGSGTFRITKPKRKKTKLKEIRAKRPARRSRRG